jgi:hypothetical protein
MCLESWAYQRRDADDFLLVQLRFSLAGVVLLSRDSSVTGGNMPAKIIFLFGAATAAIGSAVVAGLIAAVVSLAVKMPTAPLVTITTEAVIATFGGVIALAGIGADLFFEGPAPAVIPDAYKPTTPAGPDSESGSVLLGFGSGRSAAASDKELRAAIEAHALVFEGLLALRTSILRSRL